METSNGKLELRRPSRLHARQPMGLVLRHLHVRVRLAAIVAHPLGLEVVAHVVGSVLVGMFAHAEARDGYPIERVHVVIAPGSLVGRLGLLASSGAGGRRRGTGARGRSRGRNRHVRSRLAEVDVSWELRDFALGIEQSGLQIDDVLSELVVLGLEGLVVIRDVLELLHLLLELAYVRFLALSECSLLPLARPGSRQLARTHT